MRNLVLYLRTKENLLHLMLSKQAGEWETPADKDDQIAEIRISTWDGSQSLVAKYDPETSIRRGAYLSIRFRDPQIVLNEPPINWGYHEVIRFSQLAPVEAEGEQEVDSSVMPVPAESSLSPSQAIVHAEKNQPIVKLSDLPEDFEGEIAKKLSILSKRASLTNLVVNFVAGIFFSFIFFVIISGILRILVWLFGWLFSLFGMYGLLQGAIWVLWIGSLGLLAGLVFYSPLFFYFSSKNLLSWLQKTKEGQFYLRNAIARTQEAEAIYGDMLGLTERVVSIVDQQKAAIESLCKFSQVSDYLNALNSFLNSLDEASSELIKKERQHKIRYEKVYKLDSQDKISLHLSLFKFNPFKFFGQFEQMIPNSANSNKYTSHKQCADLFKTASLPEENNPFDIYFHPVVSSNVPPLSLEDYLEYLNSFVSNFLDNLPILPTSREHQRELLAQIKQQKEILTITKRELNQQMRDIRQAARKASAHAGIYYEGLFPQKKYNSRLAAAQRRAINAKKEQLLSTPEQQKAEIEKELIRLDKLALYIKSFTE